MTDSAVLERSYRKVLALYPRSFRKDNEDEILAVLMETAREGQTRIGLAEAADLIRGAVRMRLWPVAPRPAPGQGPRLRRASRPGTPRRGIAVESDTTTGVMGGVWLGISARLGGLGGQVSGEIFENSRPVESASLEVLQRLLCL
jgi:hypothetical protein